MSNNAEIVREIQVDDKVIHVHIHLTEDEIRRLLLPIVAGAFADELRRRSANCRTISSNSTEAWVNRS